MGTYLSAPVTTKTTQLYSNGQMSCTASSMQGWRPRNEDSHIVHLNLLEDISLFAVFDGHGGPDIASYLQAHLVDTLLANEQFQQHDYIGALQNTCSQLDKNIKNNVAKNTFVGSTAIIALKVQNILYVANVGDSRCLLQRDQETVELSKDHVPSLTKEIERIQKAGGFVDKMGRLNGTLSVSRAFGDFEFKSEPNLEANEQMLISVPDVRKIKLTSEDSFLFLGCDGMFELKNSAQVMQFIERGINGNTLQSQIIEQLMDDCLAKDNKTGYGCDNMTAILIVFK